MNEITFVIPFRSKTTSNDWDLHSRLLKRTIKSVLRQTSSNFQILVVYSELPYDPVSHDKLSYLRLPFDPIDIALIEGHNELTDRFKFFFMDHGRRIMYGAHRAIQAGTNYIMSVDADDLISNKIAEYVRDKDPSEAGWILKRGFVYIDQAAWLYKQPNNMNSINGSTHILNVAVIDIPDFDKRPFLINDYDLFSAHAWLEERLRERKGIQLKELPFYGVLYSRNSGSHSKEFNSKDEYIGQGIKKIIKRIIRYKPFSQTLINEFGYYKVE